MNKQEFIGLFEQALAVAAQYAEEKLQRPVPRRFLIELHDPTYRGRTVSFDEAASALFLDEARFYRVIDLAVSDVSPNETKVVAIVSGHQPAEYTQTWNPQDLGPFKPVVPLHIRAK